jgi:hypothetical protein
MGTALDSWRYGSDALQYRLNLCPRLNVIHKNKTWRLLHTKVSDRDRRILGCRDESV